MIANFLFLRELIVTQSHVDINDNNNVVAYLPTTRQIGRYLGVIIEYALPLQWMIA